MLFLFTACIHDWSTDCPNPVYNGERLPMNIQFAKGNPATGGDDEISTVRVIVFTNGELVSNTKTGIDPAEQVSGAVTVPTLVARGENNFYVFCNETEELEKILAGIKQEDAIEKITFQAGRITVPPIPMYKKINGFVEAKKDGTDIKVTTNGVTSATLQVIVDRLLAKVNFTVIKNIPDVNLDFKVEELRIRVCRLPKSTPLKEGQPYTSKEWADNISLTGTGQLDTNGKYTVADKVYTVPEGVDKITFSDIYIPEHLLSTPSNEEEATYLLIDASLRMKNGNTQLMHSMYMVNIGQNPPVSHNIKRNNQYDIYATIVGQGAMGIYAEIVAMDQHDIAVNWLPVEGLVIVSDNASDYDMAADASKNINVWNDYTVYSGILKTFHEDVGYEDILFKYGSLIAVKNHVASTTTLPFEAPTDVANLNDILWYPSLYGNPASKISNWEGIPYIMDQSAIPVENTRIAEGLGDPCKLAGLTADQILRGETDNSQWHMATRADYDILIKAADNHSNSCGYMAFGQLLIPNVKSRGTDGMLTADNNGMGQYWTTVASSAFGFTSASGPGVVAEQDAGNGYTLRCVRNTIPVSFMGVGVMPVITYQGNTTTGSPFNITSNIPYWTATLIESGSNMGTATAAESGDFSFEPGATNVKTISGKYNQTIPVYIKRKESTVARTFRILVEGTGFDGRRESVVLTATQLGYELRVFGEYTPAITDTDWVPKSGGTYTIKLKITPTDISVPAGELWVKALYLVIPKGVSNRVTTKPDQYEYEGLTMTIDPNLTPDPIGLDLVYYLNSSTDSKLEVIQNNE